MGDYHVHIHPHRPTPGAPAPGTFPAAYIDRYVEVALSRGASEVGFVEHLYRCVESRAALGEWWKRDPNPHLVAEMDGIMARELDMSLDRYVEAILEAKGRGLPVKLGLEVDFEPGTEQRVMELIAPYPWDYLIGSVHWLGAWWFLRQSAPAEYQRRGVRAAYEQYFALFTALAEAGMVDSLGHADVIKVHGHVPEGSLAYLYEPVVAAAARTGTAVEISSQGLLRTVRELYPGPEFLRLFRQAGVPITLGSDAHSPDESAFGYRPIIAAARAAGYDSYLRFERRRGIATALPDLAAAPAG
ncbi:MAG: PHP domain-containing protein [Chloroflexota bacterium]|nr:PHP domain-containing protein [Chloroflexota bacterium]